MSQIINNPDKWEIKKNINEARTDLTSSSLNGKIYIIGGKNRNYDYIGTVEVYDKYTDTCSYKTSLPIKRAGLTSSEFEGNIYVIGGFSGSFYGDSVYMYDESTDSWISKKSMITRRGYLTSSPAYDKIYAIGGETDYNTLLNVVESYNADDNTWSSKAAMSNNISDLTSCNVKYDVYTLGGHFNATNVTTDLNQAYSSILNSWYIKKSMPNDVNSLTCSSVDGKIYAIGGTNSSSTFRNTNMYDTSNNTWESKKYMSEKRTSLTSSVLDGKIYAIGGYESEVGITRKCECYTPPSTTIIDDVKPVIHYEGSTNIILEFGDTFTYPNVTATDDIVGTVYVNRSGSVNTNIAGTYTLTYTATDNSGNKAIPLIITVTVKEKIIPDTTPPEFNISSKNITVELGKSYVLPIVTATDDRDGSVSVTKTITFNNSTVTSIDTTKLGTYTVTYTASDSSGNTGTITITVKVVDLQKPEFIYEGLSTIEIVKNSNFTIPVVTATDNSGEQIVVTYIIKYNLKDTVTEIDTNKIGEYSIIYTAKDSSGNTNVMTISVIVEKGLTPEMKDILKKIKQAQQLVLLATD